MTPHSSQSESAPNAEARWSEGGWFVFWETRYGFGSRGMGLSKEAVEDLARRIRSGEERP